MFWDKENFDPNSSRYFNDNHTPFNSKRSKVGLEKQEKSLFMPSPLADVSEAYHQEHKEPLPYSISFKTPNAFEKMENKTENTDFVVKIIDDLIDSIFTKSKGDEVLETSKVFINN